MPLVCYVLGQHDLIVVLNRGIRAHNFCLANKQRRGTTHLDIWPLSRLPTLTFALDIAQVRFNPRADMRIRYRGKLGHSAGSSLPLVPITSHRELLCGGLSLLLINIVKTFLRANYSNWRKGGWMCGCKISTSLYSAVLGWVL